MTNAQTYTIKEMLEKMETRSMTDRAETNNKLDNVYTTLKDHVDESRIVDANQDKRISVLEILKIFVMGAVWLLTGSGAISGAYFLVVFLMNIK